MFRYFRFEDFACKCGCGENKMDIGFIRKLDDLREEVDFPLMVVSGYRCPKHNKKVSTTGENGPHTTGHAVDLGVDRAKAHRVVDVATKNGFTGIGVQQKGAGRFIHLDDLPNDIGQPRPTIWSY